MARHIRMTDSWSKDVISNFESAAPKYNQNANIQRECALELAQQCSKLSIPNGLWADLGAGTGLLADEIERFYPNQHIVRVDGSQKMLLENKKGSKSLLWDLNKGLPEWAIKPSFLCSSFVLHWLNFPYIKLNEWIESLSSKGLLALAVPISESFHEWKIAAQNSGELFTGLSLPSHELLIDNLTNNSEIQYQEIRSFTYAEENVFSLLKPIIKIGAHSKEKRNLTISGWRKLIEAWPQDKGDRLLKLSWQILILLIRK